MKYPIVQEIVLGDVPEIDVPEIQVSYSRASGRPFPGKGMLKKDIADFLRSTFERGDIQLQEQIIVLYLNNSFQILGYYRHSRGSITATLSDVRIILGTALKCASTDLIIAHNHPSGSLTPSQADRDLTKELITAAATCKIRVVDHFIITKDSYYSFAGHNFKGLTGVEKLGTAANRFVLQVELDLQEKKEHNKLSIEKQAAKLRITDKTLVKELTELAIVNRARELGHEPGSIRERFDRIVELYRTHVNLSHRTSQSILLQQYSTPAPISYLAGVFCGIDRPSPGAFYFEPSAGNGLLSIACNSRDFIVNEIDTVRNKNLQKQGFKLVLKRDATKPFVAEQASFQAVLTNQPFGKLHNASVKDTFPIPTFEHPMSLRPFHTILPYGQAAI